MIAKNTDLKAILNNDNISFYLMYGVNSGLIEETINNYIKPNLSKNVYNYEESEILNNADSFKENIFNKSFFEESKLIIINRVTDKILNLIKEVIEANTDDIKIILKSGALEKKSKIRTFFEKNSSLIVVPFYEDNINILSTITQNFFREKKIKISQQNINIIIERSKGNRIYLKNELEKISNYIETKKNITEEEILKLTNLTENVSISELTDNCLAKNKRKTLGILNENNTSSEDSILILKIFLYKLKRLKKLKIEADKNNNVDIVISSFKPPIFWKDKQIVKQQLKIFTLDQIKILIKKVNNLELLIKKNSTQSIQIVNNFIMEELEFTNN